MADDVTLPGTGAKVATEDDGVRHHQLVLVEGNSADFSPGYVGVLASAIQTMRMDPDGHLLIRGPVTTDERTVRINFSNSSLAVGIGTCTFTNASTAVTGTGFLDPLFPANVGDYVKIDAHAESAWAQIESIDGDTELTLATAYTGATNTGAASRAIIKPSTGTGGTISVGSGVATIACGTTAAVTHVLGRLVDYAPLVVQGGVTLSQRIANQDIYFGAWHESATPRWYAWIRFNGATNTVAICESGRNPSGAPSASEVESTTVTLPNAGTTDTERRLRVEMLVDRVRFFVDGVQVAEHFRGMPSPHDEMFTGVRVVNGTTPASGTTVTVNYLTAVNVNKLAVGILSETEQILASQMPMVPFLYSVAGVIAINTVLLTIDCLQARSLSIQCTAMGTTGVVTPEWSNDGTNWRGATLQTEAAAAATTFNAAGLWTTSVRARFFRLRLSTATTAGTTTLNVQAFQSDITTPTTTQPVSGTVTATVASISTSVVPGTAATNLGKARESAAGTTDTGVANLMIRRDAPTNVAAGVVAGDYDVPQINAQGAQYVHPTFALAGGAPFKLISAANTNATGVKASAGVVASIYAVNNHATNWAYLKFHNTNTPTAGSGVVQTYGLPPNGGGAIPLPTGLAFATGIGVTITGAPADADTTAVAANQVVVALTFH
jgi:hypothetical protein